MLLAAMLAAADPGLRTPASESSAAAAVAVVRRYYAAIDARDYRTAYRLWPGRYSFAQMKAGYATTAHVRVVPIPPFAVEGAAGSLYCEVPVEVEAVQRNGRHQRFRGQFTLRRVNDVDGSTVAQRRWHIASAKLKQVG